MSCQSFFRKKIKLEIQAMLKTRVCVCVCPRPSHLARREATGIGVWSPRRARLTDLKRRLCAGEALPWDIPPQVLILVVPAANCLIATVVLDR